MDYPEVNLLKNLKVGEHTHLNKADEWGRKESWGTRAKPQGEK